VNKFLKIIIKEILLNWLIASCILLIFGFMLENNIFKICSIISILLSKVIYEDYANKFYLNYNKSEISKFELDKIK
jgi:hypothetical protein